MLIRNLTSLAVSIIVILSTQTALANIAPTQAEFEMRDTWLANTFGMKEIAKDPNVGLHVLKNYVILQQNARFGKNFKIGKTNYYKGLFCHAPSEIIVHLPSAAKTFNSMIGVDSDGQGTVVFAVKSSGKELFRSPVTRQNMQAENVITDLNGAREFSLIVKDANDGISYDQAVWADASVLLENGQVIWLGDLPIIKGEESVSFNQKLPFSFIYDGKSSADFLTNWELKKTDKQLDANRVQTTVTYTDPATALQVTCVIVNYNDFPTTEWTVYFKNTGNSDTPIIENIRALDTTLKRNVSSAPPSWGEFTLHYNRGEFASVESYQPLTEVLGPDSKLKLAPTGGRSTNVQMPFYNLSWNSEGMICVVGWPGQWSADFLRDSTNQLNILAGQELTHLILHPGEQIRTPLIVLQFWKGQWANAQNIWRRWMIEHNIPRVDGKLPQSQLSAYSGRFYNEMQDANEQNQKEFLDKFLEVGLKPDYLWIDAGWYVDAHEQGWGKTGTWQVDTKRFPNGLKALSDYAHSKEMKFLVWFEPERVHSDTWLTNNHPEWIIDAGRWGGWGAMLDLGNPDALSWLIENTSNLITSQGINYYRQDFNMDPLEIWRKNDPNDRQGITENKHVTGYLAFWDALLQRHPGLRIDSCAGGGRRNDLETLRRAVPLWRTDRPHIATTQQCQKYGISSWIPYYGTGNLACEAPYYGRGKTPVEPYVFWSCSSPG
ncbi:MAG TPA: alpha-galactosidase, partial [Sedimentisphaerales bacterium]|nr:alpha-galactosidase [Sedimentisphaerales bacterium]